MPRYELAIIYKCLQRPDIVQAMKRATSMIMEQGGILRSVENLGERELPYRIRRLGAKHFRGHYIVTNFDSATSTLPILQDHLSKDIDVIRSRILRKETEVMRPCQEKPCDFGEINDAIRSRLYHDTKKCIKKL